MLRKRATLLVAILVSMTPLASLAHHAIEHIVLSTKEKQRIIDQRLDFYKKRFSEINFAHLAGGEQWRDDYIALINLLGEKPVNLDYEHPPGLAADVMVVSIQRLSIMLQQDIVSAALYRTDKQGPLKGQQLCVLTLNPKEYVADNLETTAYMVDLPEQLMGKLHPSRLLDSREHLRFTIDHEIFHCLESHLLGGAPMTQKEFGGDYNQFRRESGADAFALAMHLKSRPARSRYAENITLIRSLWLFTEGPNRCTYESMLDVYNTPASELTGKSTLDLFKLAIQARNSKSRDYEFYVAQRNAAIHAAKQLGYHPEFYGNRWANLLNNTEPDPERVQYKIDRYRYYYARLFDDQPVNFKPADPAVYYD